MGWILVALCAVERMAWIGLHMCISCDRKAVNGDVCHFSVCLPVESKRWVIGIDHHLPFQYCKTGSCK